MSEQTINITIKTSAGRVYAESNDLPGFYVSGSSREEVLGEVPQAIETMFAAQGMTATLDEMALQVTATVRD